MTLPRSVADEPVPPLPRAVFYLLAALFAAALAWAVLARLDIIAIAQGKIITQSSLQIVQPAESGIVREILVKEGETVRSGQVLVRMDARISDADTRQLQSDLRSKSLQLRRIDAELGTAPLAMRDNDDAAAFAQVQAQFQARRQANRDAIEAEQAIMAKAEQDLKGALEVESKFTRTLPIYQQQEQAFDKLNKDGFAGRLMALERQRDRIEKEQDLAAQRFTIESLRATIAQARTRMAQITSSYRQQLQNERIDAASQFQRLREDWERLAHRRDLLELRAPHEGVVKDLATRTVGSVVAAGTVLLTLVPASDQMQAEVWVTNQDVGLVRAGLPARLKLVAYPFQRHGLVDGEVIHVSPDSSELPIAPNLERRTADIGHVLPATGYRTLIAIRAPSRPELRLGPGMQLSAEMHLGTRSVLDYLLSPIQRAAHEAAREP
jgi:hemolysin D